MEYGKIQKDHDEYKDLEASGVPGADREAIEERGAAKVHMRKIAHDLQELIAPDHMDKVIAREEKDEKKDRNN